MSKHTGPDDFVLVGKITGAHGVRGGMRIHSFAESIALYQVGKKIRIEDPGGTILEKTITSVKPHGRGLLMAFDAVVDRGQAEALAGSSLYVEKSKLPPLEEDTYYWADLLGLKVMDRSGSILGVLEEVIPTPGNDVYVVRKVKTAENDELLLPAIGTVVVSVDLEERIMVVEPPEGL